MEQTFLRLTLSPTIRRHQLRLPPINTSRPTLQPEQPCCENHHLHTRTMAAETQQEQEFHRLTLSPTVRQHQLRLPPIKTRPSKPTPSMEDSCPRGAFVDELYEFPQPPSPSNPHIIISSTTESAEGGSSCKCTNPFCEYPFHHHPKAPAAPITPPNVLMPCDALFKKTQFLGPPEFFGAAAGARFDHRFGDLPAPIRWRLMEACKTAMRELVHEVEKEMKGSDAEKTVPEDVCTWRDVVAAAEVVGVDVDEPKRHLINVICLL